MTKRWTLIRVGVLWAGVLMAYPVIKTQDVRYNFMPGTGSPTASMRPP
jgi:uncharacterized integral membrane protein